MKKDIEETGFGMGILYWFIMILMIPYFIVVA